MNRYVRLGGLLAAMCAVPGGADAGEPSLFTAIEPCRIVDTRTANGGPGSFAAGQIRTFHVVGSTSDFAAQGGKAGGCGIPGHMGTEPRVGAVMFNLVAVNAQGAGNLRAWASDKPEPAAAVMNFAKVFDATSSFQFNIANGIIIPVSQDAVEGADLTVKAQVSGVDLVIDVLGYFMPVPLVQYQGLFMQGQGAERSQCAAWNTFLQHLYGRTFSRISLFGSAGGPFSCSDDAAVAQIVNALANKTAVSVVCDGRTWNVGGCGADPLGGTAWEVNSRTTAGVCSVACDGATLRPCSDQATGSPDWGGLGASSCGAPSQNIVLRVEK